MLTLLTSFCNNPRAIGSVTPSSPRLAAAMAQESLGAAHTIELGSGTGPITAALLKLNISSENLISVEVCPILAETLRQRFPQLEVRCESAETTLMSSPLTASRTAIISSLPFKSLPESVSLGIQQALSYFLSRNPESWLVQFTYGLGQPFSAPENWHWVKLKTIWRNTPPAAIWLLTKNG